MCLHVKKNFKCEGKTLNPTMAFITNKKIKIEKKTIKWMKWKNMNENIQKKKKFLPRISENYNRIDCVLLQKKNWANKQNKFGHGWRF